MKRIFFLVFVAGLLVCARAMASMSIGTVREETRFLTDKMAYELSLTTPQYNDVYEINYDFIYTVRYLLDGVARGDAGALSDYYEALDIRNDDLRWVLSDFQYRRFLRAEYFCNPIDLSGGRWTFRVYVNYPNRSLFYFGIPPHYYTYRGAHRRPGFHHVSFYRGRYHDLRHYPEPYRVRPPRRPVRPERPVAPHRPVAPRPPEHVRPPRPKPEHRPAPQRKPSTVRPSSPDAPERPSRRPSAPDRKERVQRRATTVEKTGGRGEAPKRESGRKREGEATRSVRR